MAIVFGERASGDRVAMGNAGRYSRTERWSRSSRQEASHQQRLHRAAGGNPVTAYKGGITATERGPGKGQKIDRTSPPSSVTWPSWLRARTPCSNSVGGAKKLYSYGFVFNGFAAE